MVAKSEPIGTAGLGGSPMRPEPGPAYHPRDVWVPAVLGMLAFALLIWPSFCLGGEDQAVVPDDIVAPRGFGGPPLPGRHSWLYLAIALAPTLFHMARRWGARWEDADVLSRHVTISHNSKNQRSYRQVARVRLLTGGFAGRTVYVPLSNAALGARRLSVLVKTWPVVKTWPLIGGPHGLAAWPRGDRPSVLRGLAFIAFVAVIARLRNEC